MSIFGLRGAVPAACRFRGCRRCTIEYHKSGFEIIAVNVDKDHKAALEFMKNMHASFPKVFDSTGNLAKRYGLDAMPSSFVYGRDGRLVATHQGFVQDKADSIEYDIFQLLNKGRSK